MSDNSFAEDLKSLSNDEDKKILPISNNALKDKLNDRIEEFENLYPNRRSIPDSGKNILDQANKVYKKASATKEEINTCIGRLEKAINKKKDKDKEEANRLQKQENERAKKEAEALKNPNAISDIELKKLAKEPPNPETGKNPWRPYWTHYNLEKSKWTVNDNELAEDIVNTYEIYRVQDDGKVLFYIQYDAEKGSWHKISDKDLRNFINIAFENPNFDNPDAENPKFANDLHSAKEERNIFTLIDGKIDSLASEEFDDIPEYIVHFKNFDFDVLNLKKLSFSPDNHFQTDKDYNADADILTLPPVSIESNRMNFDEIIPETKKWWLASLGDTDTFHAFLERLGYSFLHTYEENFFIFIKSAGGQGKSTLFNFLRTMLFNEKDVSALDIDQIADKGSFDASELHYKDINLTSDIKSSFLPDSAISMIKTLSGNDKRNLRQKFKNTAGFANHASLWFNMNDFPRLEKYDDAIARRADLFTWNAIPNFEKEINMEEVKKEVPKLVAVALIYAHRMLIREPIKYDYFANPIQLYRSKQMQKAYKEEADKYNYFNHFIDNCCIKKDGLKIGCGYLLKEYREYILNVEGGKTKPTLATLTDHLKKIGIHKSEKPTSWKDGYNTRHTGTYVFEGIALKDGYMVGVQEEEMKYNKEIERKRWKSPFVN